VNIRQSPYRIDQSQRRAIKRRKKRRFGIGLLAMISIFGVFSFMNNEDTTSSDPVQLDLVAAESDSSNRAKAEQDRLELQRKIEASPLSRVELPTQGQSAIGTLELGTIIAADNEQQVPIASITKLITALVILEKQPLAIGELGRVIELTAQDEQYYWDYVALLGTITPVTAGFSMTQYESLQAMLLTSSNNMSDTIVDNYFASSQEYVNYANDYLRRQGLENTQVADATGFSPDSKSTPSDLVVLAQLALNNPIIREIVAQPEAMISVAGSIPNYNPLITDPDVIGLKPGATDEAGYTLLFAANLPNSNGESETFIGVTLGIVDRAEYVQTARNMIINARTAFLQQ